MVEVQYAEEQEIRLQLLHNRIVEVMNDFVESTSFFILYKSTFELLDNIFYDDFDMSVLFDLSAKRYA